MFDRKLIQITSIDNSFHIDFSTVKILIHKLSSNTIKDRLKSGLEGVKRRDNDRYNTNNYLLTLRQLLNIARSHVDEELDTRALDNFTNRRSEDEDDQAQEVQINRTQFSSPQRKRECGKSNNANGNRKRDRSSDEDENSDYHVNEFGDKVYGYKKKKPTYQRTRVNNFATNVTEGGQRQNSYKQNNYKQNSYRQSKNKDTRHAGNKETRFNKNTERKDHGGRSKDTNVRKCLPCGICKETTHGNLI